MADLKISELTNLTAADPANDMIPIVDVSATPPASGTTKRISINNILACSPSATLASATISGDLTVATSVLKVDTANTRVGINTTSINGGPFNVKISPSIDAKFVIQDGFTTGNVRLAAVDNAYTAYKVMDYSALSHTWYNSGSTAMTLNSTGLGVGVTPSAWAAAWKTAQVGSRLVLTVTGSDTFVGNNWYNDGAYKFINADYATYYDQTTGKHVWGTSTTSGAANGTITWNPAMTLDASGNLLVGTTSGTFRGTFVVAGGANRDILAAGVTAVSDGFQVKWNNTTSKINVIISNIPTSSAGLAAGTLWNDAGTIKIA